MTKRKERERERKGKSEREGEEVTKGPTESDDTLEIQTMLGSVSLSTFQC